MKKVIKMSDKTRDSAIDWYVRMRADDVTKSAQRAHAAWLAADPENARAYEAVEATMAALDGLDDWMHEELGELNLRAVAKHRRHMRRWTAGIASAAALFLAVIFWSTLDTGVHYETVKAEQREVALDDGSRIHLNTATAVSVHYTEEMREVSIHRGEGLFDVNPDERPFVVRAADTSVIAVGTRFRVYLDDSDVIVTVLEGTVAVAAADVPETEIVQMPFLNADAKHIIKIPGSVLLHADQQTTVGASGALSATETVNADNVTAWREGKLVFDATPLRQVVREISRHTPGEVVVADGVPDHPVTGLILIRSPEAMLRFLSSAVPVTPVKMSSQLTVLHGNS